MNSGVARGQPGANWGPTCRQLGVDLGSVWGRSGEDLGIALGTLGMRLHACVPTWPQTAQVGTNYLAQPVVQGTANSWGNGCSTTGSMLPMTTCGRSGSTRVGGCVDVAAAGDTPCPAEATCTLSAALPECGDVPLSSYHANAAEQPFA